MQIGRIAAATRVRGKQQGYAALPVRDEQIQWKVGGLVNSMLTAWLPTPRELEALNAGATVHLRIVGSQHPPINVTVGEIPE
jgi:hypothetical protein